MAKGRKAVAPAKKLSGKKLTFVGKFGYGGRDLKPMLDLVATNGGSVVDDAKVAPDYVVAGDGVGGKPPTAVAKLQKRHPQVQVIDQAGFYQLINPTPEEFKRFMTGKPQGYEFWNAVRDGLWKANATLDLTGTDFRNCRVEGVLYGVCLDKSDFRGATISAYFGNIKGAKFDGATMSDGSFSKAEDCSLKNVTMDDTRWNPAEFKRCDFSGAKLKIDTGSYTKASDCLFKKVDFSGSDLESSVFKSADFSGANLIDTKLQETDFSGAILTGANLTRADLHKVKFVGADLRKAKFNNASLSSADLTGALIDGADFTGANVMDATLNGLDLSKAKNLAAKAARPVGPNMKELAKVANDSHEFTTSIVLVMSQDEFVMLSAGIQRYGQKAYSSAEYWHEQLNHGTSGPVESPNFEQGILNLTDLVARMFARGTPDFETVKVDAQKCPLRGQELQDLAIAAWHEACGLPAPSKADLEQDAKRVASATSSLREVMIAELHGGAAGIKKWNDRPDKERGKLGKLTKHDFSNAKLVGVWLGGQHLERCNFAGASLRNASLGGAQLKGANFAGANLSGARLAGAKVLDVSFEGAKATKCNLRAARYLRCNFRSADLSGSDFSFADLRGADLSGATLTNVEFRRTAFDEHTILPAGFIPPEGLQWKGAGLRPGTFVPAAPKSGSMDFESFLEQLNAKVENARMQKAGSMLKAESFQLFAEVKSDGLLGIVKSQSSKELLYSCRLSSTGQFGCCTQNLRPCGGLRGALCKHLLVLIIGLAKARQLDPATVNHWIELSGTQKPAIDEEAMSATFIKYKGAEAGEIDWRPTETLPEDFYAM